MIRSELLSVNLQPRRLLLTPQKYLVVQSVKINFVKLWLLLVLQGYLEVSNPLHFTFLWCFMIKQFGPGRHFQVAKFSDVLHFSKSWLQTSASILTLHKFHSIILKILCIFYYYFFFALQRFKQHCYLQRSITVELFQCPDEIHEFHLFIINHNNCLKNSNVGELESMLI